MIEIPDVGLYIPSAGRCEEQPTLEHIPKRWLTHTHLVVPGEDYWDYRNLWQDKVNGEILVPKLNGQEVHGIHNTRQWVMNNAPENFVIFLSDDLKLFRRADEYRTRPSGVSYYPLIAADEEEWDVMLILLYKWMRYDGFVHVGISQRQVSHTTLEKYVDVTRMHDLYGYDRKAVNSLGCRFDRLPVMEDMDMTLQLFRLGYPNRVSFYYTWDQRHSNAGGGCSTYRNNHLQAKCAYKLRDLHEDFVTVVEKETKSWKGMETRTDCRIQWKQAYKSAVRI